ncbi:ParB N-terminal domain-containing protein [Barnesiella intestinihominis]
MSELAESISQHGLLQPLLVRPLTLGGYQIVAGERRIFVSK